MSVLAGNLSLRWCEPCRIYRTDNVSHCRLCDVCIRDRDHHCTALGQCVGRRNYRTFLLATLLACSIACHGGIICVLKIYYSFGGSSRGFFSTLWRERLAITNLSACVGMGSFTGSLLLYHLLLMFRGTTTLTHMRDITAMKTGDNNVVREISWRTFARRWREVWLSPPPLSLVPDLHEPVWEGEDTQCLGQLQLDSDTMVATFTWVQQQKERGQLCYAPTLAYRASEQSSVNCASHLISAR
mmetsp:Transcript_53190/g.115501  ORF Transcript_53190/g.115501 Transcript_53190/m.115501 type:complete len:242 (-) Transcript_53190:37-762(-)